MPLQDQMPSDKTLHYACHTLIKIKGYAKYGGDIGVLYKYFIIHQRVYILYSLFWITKAATKVAAILPGVHQQNKTWNKT